MTYTGTIEFLPTLSLELDLENPRINQIRDQNGGNPSVEAVRLALYDMKGSFISLRESIRTSGTIISPILVNRTNGSDYQVLDGNTRLSIYKDFLKDDIEGQWEKIPAMVYENLKPEEMESIRLQCHLVGARDWDPYQKGRYLRDLSENEMMPMERLVAYCGGKQREVESLIRAFKSMETDYRPCLADPENDFEPRLMTAFQAALVEKVKRALRDHHYDMRNFSEWARDEKFDRNEHVRKLPDILNDTEAKEAFLEGGSIEALQILSARKLQETAQQSAAELSFEEICSLLLDKLRGFSAHDVKKIFATPEHPATELIQEIKSEIDDTLDFVEGKS